MKRRAFIMLIGGAAVTLPFCVRAQQPAGRVYRVGYFAITSRERSLHLMKAFEEGLRSLGYRVGGCPRLLQTWSGSAWTSSFLGTM